MNYNQADQIIGLLKEISNKLDILTGPPKINLTPQIGYPPAWTGSDCIDNLGHNYPNPWNSITPPTCMKCGKQAWQYTITSGGSTITSTKASTDMPIESFDGKVRR